MGLLVGEDGHSQGWLAALLCCCAAVTDDEPVEKEKHKHRSGAIASEVCYEQPTAIKGMIPRLAVAVQPMNSSSEAGFDDFDRVRLMSQRPPSLKPLDLGETPFFSRMSLPNFDRDSWGAPQRISISTPTAFRRLELTAQQRASLVPLQLEPVVLRDSVVGSLDEKSVLDHDLSHSDNLDESYHARALQYQAHRISTITTPSPSDLTSHDHPRISSARVRMPIRPSLSSRSSSSSMRSLNRYPVSAASNTSTPPSRHSFDWSRLARKRANTHKTSSSVENADYSGAIEREVLELNTIVEERRAEGVRTHTAKNTQHVSAVAPSLAIRARSETLTDIGSAFSRPLPLTSEDSPQLPSNNMRENDTNVAVLKERLSRPFTNMPDLSATFPTDSTASHAAPNFSRINGWLSALLTSKSQTAQVAPPPRNSLDSCVPAGVQRGRAVSSASSTTVTTSHHSRSATDDSAMTPASSPPSSTRNEWKSGKATVWAVQPPSPTKVGLAF